MFSVLVVARTLGCFIIFFGRGEEVATTFPTTTSNTTLVDTTSICSGGHAGHFHAIVT